MTALVSFERVFEVLDLPSLIQEKPDAVALPPRRLAARVRPRRVHLPARRRGLAGLAWRSVARTESRDTGQVLTDVTLRRRARPDGRAGRPVRRRQDHDHPPGRPAVRRDVRRRPRRRPRRPRRDPAVAGGRGRLRHPGRPHVPRHDPRQPALRPPGRHRRARSGTPSRPPRSRRLVRGAARRPRHRRRRPRLPALRRRAAAARHRPAAAQGARRSSCSTRRPPTSTASPRPPCSGRSTPRSRAARRW